MLLSLDPHNYVWGPGRALRPSNSHSRNTGVILAMDLAGFDITDVMRL
jgi:hypothetical protein